MKAPDSKGQAGSVVQGQGLQMRAAGLDLPQVPLMWVIFVVVGAYLQSY